MEYEFFASCLSGLESVLADELRSYGIIRVRPLNGGVAFFGSDKDAYYACLWSRLASRIVLVIDRIQAKDADELYTGVSAIAWETILLPCTSVGVHAAGTNEQLRNSRFTALRTKDAIVDRLRKEGQQGTGALRAQANRENRAFIDVRVRANKATISLDLSGEALNHRWYLLPDDDQNAPYDCSLAAGALACAGWNGDLSRDAALLETSCRSGILLNEAVSISCDLAPGLARTKWGFQAWAHYDAALFDKLKSQAQERFKTRKEELTGSTVDSQGTNDRPDLRRVRFVGISTSSPAIAKARKHIRQAGLRSMISMELGNVSDVGSIVQRLQRIKGQKRSSDTRACVIVSNLDAQSSDASASIQARNATFLAAARSVQGEQLNIALNGGDIAIDFPPSSCTRFTLGQGRAQANVEIFASAPEKRPLIQVIDLDKGIQHEVEVYDANSAQFAARFRKVVKERRKWAAQEGVSCYRLYDADLPDYAIAIDWYEGAGCVKGNNYLHIAEYAPPASIDTDAAKRRFNDVLTLAPLICGIRPDHVFSKRRLREKGGSQYARAGKRAYVTTVSENGYLLEIDLAQRLDTGLFLDHRPIRAYIQQLASGKRFLNLFAYTGVASVYAAGGGALSTTTIDLSSVYLDWAQRNMEANGFAGAHHKFIKSDVMRWITQARRGKERYDLIFVDPPTFSNSKSMGKKTWDVQRDHVELLIGVTHLLAEDGLALFSCNLRSFKPDYEKLQKYGVELEDITSDTIPIDFARTPKIHKCYKVRRVRAAREDRIGRERRIERDR